MMWLVRTQPALSLHLLWGHEGQRTQSIQTLDPGIMLPSPVPETTTEDSDQFVRGHAATAFSRDQNRPLDLELRFSLETSKLRQCSL